MAEQTNVPATTTDKGKDKRTRTPRTSNAARTMEHSAAIKAYANAKSITDDKAGKLFRARLRANADTYVKNGGKAHVKNAPWPSHPRKALAAIFPDVPAFKR
jgi:hypothetical protein